MHKVFFNNIEGNHMVVSEKKMSKTKVDPVDQWLAKEGYFRKATPRDPNCLFRSVSEQVYNTQHYHLRVRRECIELMEKKRSLFENSIATPFDYYIKEMECFTEYGGPNEIRALSLRYEQDIIVFVGERQICENVTNNGFKTAILLCHTESKQYEPVYPMAFIESAAYCQSIVYEVLYKNLFKMYDVKAVADKMLNNGGDTFRHDKFFQKGNLDIREQLIEDLYKKVKSTSADEAHNQSDRKKGRKVNGNDVGEICQSDWKRAPIPYKVAKALASDHYRNIELDIWHELKREVKSAGWNRFGNSVLQEGGKCLIEITVNDLERSNRNIRAISDSSAGESSAKSDQKLKQGNLWLQGYIQKMSTNKEPVLVFIQDLGERKYVPYDALKPLPRKPRQKTWLPVNRNYSVAPDLNRRWKKSYNSFSRKRKPNDTKVAYFNAINIEDANDVNKTNFENEEHISDLPEDNRKKELNLNNSIENCSTHVELTTNEQTSSLPAEVILDQSVSNNVEQKVPEEYKKRSNNTLRNKMEKSNGFGKGFKTNTTKTKPIEANHCVLYDNGPMNGNPNVPYVVPDGGNIYPFCQYVPKFAENQISDPLFQHPWYKLHPVQMYEEPYRSINHQPYYGPLTYGLGHNGVQPLPPPNVQNSSPYMQDEKHLANAMQNCSLTCNEGGVDTSAEIPNFLPLNGAQNGARPNQGPKNASELPQTLQKGKQTINGKANRMRARHNNMRRVYTQFPSQAAIPGFAGNTYDTPPRRPNMHVVQPSQRCWDQCVPQSPMNAGTMNAYGTPQYATSSNVPPMYEYTPQNESNLGNAPVYYASNGSYGHFVQSHVDESLHYQQVNEGYPPSYPQTGGPPVAYHAPPMMYQQLHYMPPPVQEQWNQMPYMPCATLSTTLAEPPSNGPAPV